MQENNTNRVKCYKDGYLERQLSYNFKDNNYLRTALLHRSYANEHREEGKNSNERLEFLGDAVLQLVVTSEIYKSNPDMSEGKLSKLRSYLVCEDSLYKCADKIGLGSYIMMSKGTRMSGGASNPAIVSDAFEAIIGAIYLDGGYDEAKATIFKLILDNYEANIYFHDSKSELQETLAVKGMDDPTYKLVGESGPDHNKLFEIKLLSGDKVLGEGTGPSKKRAEMNAAANALKNLALNGEF